MDTRSTCAAPRLWWPCAHSRVQVPPPTGPAPCLAAKPPRHPLARSRAPHRLPPRTAPRTRRPRLHLSDKNQFLATVSHELRTPLTAVIGLAELLRDPQQTFDSNERADLINTIVESGFDVANLVEDLLTAARQEAGQLKVVAVPVNLSAQVNQTLESMNPSREIKVSGSASRAFADPGRVRQILRNLLTNATKYGGKQVTIHLDQMGETVRATVIDDGPGVSPGQEDRIFDRYGRAHDDDSHPGSVGIGLSISRELARHIGGDLRYVRSDGITRFELLLPVHDD